MFQTFNFFLFEQLTFFNVFCQAVAIRAVVHFGLKLATAQNYTFFDFQAIKILVLSCFFEQMTFEQMTHLHEDDQSKSK
jgi:hypothetical protein